MDWKKNPTLEPYPANSRTLQKPRKRPCIRNPTTQDMVENENLAQTATKIYSDEAYAEKKCLVKEVLIPTGLQGV